MARLQFDANAVAPSVPFEPLPAGKYVAVITESSQEATKNGRGSFLKMRLEVIEGEYKGRALFTRLNLSNPSDMAVAIARAELSAICRAVGVMTPTDSQELHNLPLVIKVACKKRQDSSEIDNEIKGYESRNAAATAAMQSAPNGSSPKAPWGRPTPPMSHGNAPSPPV